MTLTPEQVRLIAFSDEVWAMGGGHTTDYITCKTDGSDRFDADNVTHKYRKRPAWMFSGVILDGKKGPCLFWEDYMMNINSQNYCTYFMPLIEDLFSSHPLRQNLIFQQDNASSHRSKYTTEWLRRHRIPCLKWPPYSPDLNLIEHVWSWMKNYIQKHYIRTHYDAAKISKEQLRPIILEAWNAVPEDFIEKLYESWWRRCKAVIDARGGPTKY
jgi:DDE superfamily endonuclease